MIQLETPGDTRGVAVLPPPGWSTNPTFIDTLLAGLEGHPLLNPVTASGLFAAVPVAPLQRSIVAPPAPGRGLEGHRGRPGRAPRGVGRRPSDSEPSTAVGAATSAGTASLGRREQERSPPPATTGPAARQSAHDRPGADPLGATIASAVTGDVVSELGPDVPASWPPATAWPAWWPSCPRMRAGSTSLNKELLTAESSDLTEAQRQSLLRQISDRHHPGHQPDHAAPLVVDHPHLHQGCHPPDGAVRPSCTPGWSCG